MRETGWRLRDGSANQSQTFSLVWTAFVALALAGCAAHTTTKPNPSPLLVEQSSPRTRVIYLAERHNEPAHHKLQERIIRSFHQRRNSVTVGMEMIDVTQQRALDQYLEKKISWTMFARNTGFESGWGKTSAAYKRILEWCRRNEVPVLGLNAPRSITQKIASNQKLTPAEATLVPKFPAPPRGFQKFRAAMAGHPGSGSVRRYYEAQRAWDATMAATILSWLHNHRGTLVVLLGQIHADPQTGVPWYVARNSDVTQVIIYPKE
jgi:aminopeptidase N